MDLGGALALPQETFTVDIHCVTKWSKLDTTWTGVSVDTLLEGVATEAEYLTAWCDGGYTTNLPLEDVTGGKAWVAYKFDGEPLEPEHGGPARLLVPHLYFWKSAKWVRGPDAARSTTSPASGRRRLPQPRRPVAGAALLERLTVGPRIAWRIATVREAVDETPRARTLVLDVPGWPGHLAGQHVDVRLTAEDGYQAQRSYSIASAPEDDALELTVERIDDGEVSPYLMEELRAGDELELRGPIGGYFTWERRRRAAAAGRRRVRARAADGDAAPPGGARQRRRRAPARLGAARRGRALPRGARALARRGWRSTSRSRASAPPGWAGFARRIDADDARRVGPPPASAPRVFVCGPTAFVERAADLLVAARARRRAPSTPSASARQEDEMSETASPRRQRRGRHAREVFGAEMTRRRAAASRAARARGRRPPRYEGAGVVLRCPGCGDVAVRIGALPDRYVVMLAGRGDFTRSRLRSGRTTTMSAIEMISSTGRSARDAWSRIASGLDAS